MSREIKFRAFEIIEKTMHYNVESGIYEDPDEIIPFDSILGLGRFIVMQYTGQKDKKGIKIYEGDVVKESRKTFKNKKYFVVVWNNDIGSYYFKPIDKTEIARPCFNIGTIKSLEVIGNIYENPELLSS